MTKKEPAQVTQQTNLGLSEIQALNNLIISIGEARKILGKDAYGLRDDQITGYILELTQLAQELLNVSILP